MSLIYFDGAGGGGGGSVKFRITRGARVEFSNKEGRALYIVGPIFQISPAPYPHPAIKK